MPLYGKGRMGRHDEHYLPKKGFGKIIVRRKPEKRIEHRTEFGEWKQFSSPLSRVSTNLGTDIAGWVRQRFEHTRRPLTVLDWGCGDGKTIEQVTQRFPGIVHAYGYDHRSYAPWLASKNVKYIHQDPGRMPRYIKKGSMDLIYSHYGITHLLQEMRTQDGIEYLHTLVEKLRPGGLFAMNMDAKHVREIAPMVLALKRLLKGRYRIESLEDHTASRSRYFVHVVRLE